MGTVESGDLDDLRRDMILGIAAALLVIACLLVWTGSDYAVFSPCSPECVIIDTSYHPRARQCHSAGRSHARLHA